MTINNGEGLKPYYDQSGITIYCGDCREILPQLEGDSIVADPPYGIGVNYGEESKDDLPTFKAAISFVSSRPQPSVVFCPPSKIFDVPVRPQWIGVWRKNWTGLALRSYPFYPHWEALLFYNLKGDFSGNKGHRNDVFEYASIRPDKDGHPTPKPLALIRELVNFMPGELVIDPFLGSGTTLVAAKQLGRKAIGIEINEDYCKIAVERLRQTVMGLKCEPAKPDQGVLLE